MNDFLQVSGKTFLIFGVANRKSVAWFIAKSLEEQGAKVVYSVRSESRRQSLLTQLAGKDVFICDVEKEGAAADLARAMILDQAGAAMLTQANQKPMYVLALLR